ncbi:MAG: hypothetical protein ACREVG_13350 [Burkholderiales bacterium]
MRKVILVLISLFVAGPAHADPTQEALSEIVRCSGIADPGERLKCFDAAAPRAKSALAEQETKEKRGILDWFWFSRPRKPVTKPEEFGKPAPVAPGGEITQSGNTRQARESFERIATAGKADASTCIALALACLSLGDHAAALAALAPFRQGG